MTGSAAVLAIDLGNGGPKVGVVGCDGTVLAWAAHDVPTRTSDDGTSVQNAHQWYLGIVAAARESLDRAAQRAIAVGQPTPHIIAVGITGQWGSTVPVAADGCPAGDVLLWSDTRGRDLVQQVVAGRITIAGYAPHKVLRWIRLTGGGPSLAGADPTGHSLVLQHLLPQTYAATRWLLEPIDYIGLLLTGEVAATPASMTLSWLTDNRLGAPLSYDDVLVRRSHRDADRLPPLRPTGSVLGAVLPHVAADLGISAGVSVVCGIPDLHAAVLGSGTIEDFASHVTISTTSWLGAQVPFKKTDVLHSIATVPGFSDTHPLVANNHETAGVALEWLRTQVLTGSTYDSLLDEAGRVPAGSDGVIFTPWLDGERSPVEDKRLRASFLHMSMRTHRGHLARAVLEGVAYNARWLLEYYEKFLGRRVSSLRVLGGGAVSDLWCSIHADVMQRRIERVADPRAAQLRGVALWALVCMGELRLDEVPGLVPVDAVFEPDDGDAAVAYARGYAQFRHLHRTLKPLHHALTRGTQVAGSASVK